MNNDYFDEQLLIGVVIKSKKFNDVVKKLDN